MFHGQIVCSCGAVIWQCDCLKAMPTVICRDKVMTVDQGCAACRKALADRERESQ